MDEFYRSILDLIEMRIDTMQEQYKNLSDRIDEQDRATKRLLATIEDLRAEVNDNFEKHMTMIFLLEKAMKAISTENSKVLDRIKESIKKGKNSND